MIRIASPIARRKARIEIIPLIDIIFFLLATFVLVSMSMVRNKGVPIRLPSASTGKTLNQNETLIIRIAQSGDISIDGKNVNLDELGNTTTAFQQTHTDPRVIIQGDTDASYGQVIAALDRVRQNGITKIAVQTTQPKS